MEKLNESEENFRDKTESNEKENSRAENKNTGFKTIEEIYDDLCLTDDKEDNKLKTKKKPFFKEISDIESEDRISQVCVLKTGDTQYYDILKFTKDPVTACGIAIRRNEKIYTDSKSIKYIIEEEIARDLINIDACKIPEIIYAGDIKGSKEMSEKYNLTRTAAGYLTLGNELNETIVLTSYDETALLSVARLIEKGVKPAAVLAFPGGTGTQNKSKQYLRENSYETPTISTMSAKGGREIAAICMAEIIKIVNEKMKNKSL